MTRIVPTSNLVTEVMSRAAEFSTTLSHDFVQMEICACPEKSYESDPNVCVLIVRPFISLNN